MQFTNGRRWCWLRKDPTQRDPANCHLEVVSEATKGEAASIDVKIRPMNSVEEAIIVAANLKALLVVSTLFSQSNTRTACRTQVCYLSEYCTSRLQPLCRVILSLDYNNSCGMVVISSLVLLIADGTTKKTRIDHQNIHSHLRDHRIDHPDKIRR